MPDTTPMLALAIAGLAGMMVAEVPQVLSGFLPSPSTAYDKASGAIDTGPESLAVMNRSKIKGTVVTIIMAGSVTLMAYAAVGHRAWFLFLAAMAVLALFLDDFNDAQRRGAEAAEGRSLCPL